MGRVVGKAEIVDIGAEGWTVGEVGMSGLADVTGLVGGVTGRSRGNVVVGVADGIGIEGTVGEDYIMDG